MPPRPKFTKEQVLQAALGIIDSEGESALTARRLGEVLGSSPRPIFTLFEGMQDLKKQLHDGPAMDAFNNYFDEYLSSVPEDDAAPFKRFGYCLVRFATERPGLFGFLFISSGAGTSSFSDWVWSEQAESSIKLLMAHYELDEETASVLFRETWLHTFSLCVLRVTGAAEVSDEEVSLSLSRGFQGLLSLARKGTLLNPLMPR
ncbi:MAG: hypothetical protein ACI36W_03590 [Coriobacteriales bacterium]